MTFNKHDWPQMSKKTKVMSHDPLAELADDAAAHTVAGASPVAGLALAAADQPGAGVTPDAPVTLPPSLTVADVAEVLEMLRARLDGASKLVINGADVEATDGAGLQLLAVFMKAAMQRELAVEWSGASATLCAAAQQLGLGDLLGLSAAQAA